MTSVHASQNTALDFIHSAQEPWVRLATALWLDRKSPQSKTIQHLKQETVAHPLIKSIIKECKQWPGNPIKSHKDAKLIIHKINILADIGLTKTDNGISEIAEKLMAHRSDDNAFLSRILLPSVFGGDDKPHWNWILCDFPLIIAALCRFGYHKDKRVTATVRKLISLIDRTGWLCSSSLLKFKGPGRRTDPCPYATLAALKALAHASKTAAADTAIQSGTDMLLHFWKIRTEKKYYLFGIGTDFMKLKYPMIWFDILHVVDTLSYFPAVRTKRAFKDMLKILIQKKDPRGLYTPESVWMAYKGYDFSQKKNPSATLTAAVLIIQKRLGILQ